MVFPKGYRPVKMYRFALYDEDTQENYYVLCDTVNGYVTGQVKEIVSQKEYRRNVTR